MAWTQPFTSGFIHSLGIWSSVTINHYRFKTYEQSGIDYSGNPLTGVAPDIIVSGVDVFTKTGLYINATINYTDHISLNDAGTAYAADYTLLGTRLGYRKAAGKISYDVFGGVDNALDQKYSLGNDLNAVGGRFYNLAAGRNFYGGLKLSLR